LTLVLPDQSRSYIPASWTDLSGEESKKLVLPNSQSTPGIIATTPHLHHARKIVDALLCSLNSSEHEDTKASKEENHRVQTIGTVAHASKPIILFEDLENHQQSTKTRHHSRSGRPHQQDGPSGGHGTGGKP
jgi:hypothetical protein